VNKTAGARLKAFVNSAPGAEKAAAATAADESAEAFAAEGVMA
jgi:hypothetical protein